MNAICQDVVLPPATDDNHTMIQQLSTIPLCIMQQLQTFSLFCTFNYCQVVIRSYEIFGCSLVRRHASWQLASIFNIAYFHLALCDEEGHELSMVQEDHGVLVGSSTG